MNKLGNYLMDKSEMQYIQRCVVQVRVSATAS